MSYKCECGEKFVYKNRFNPACPACGKFARHICFECKQVIKPEALSAWESIDGFHHCYNESGMGTCDAWTPNASKEFMLEMIQKARDEYEKYYGVTFGIGITKESAFVIQTILTNMMLSSTNRFCVNNVPIIRARKDHFKVVFKTKFTEKHKEKENEILSFIKSKEIDDEFYASDIDVGLRNTDNILLFDIIGVCRTGTLQRININPARYKKVSNKIRRCPYLDVKRIYHCVKCENQISLTLNQYSDFKDKGQFITRKKLKHKCHCGNEIYKHYTDNYCSLPNTHEKIVYMGDKKK